MKVAFLDDLVDSVVEVINVLLDIKSPFEESLEVGEDIIISLIILMEFLEFKSSLSCKVRSYSSLGLDCGSHSCVKSSDVFLLHFS